MAKVLVPLADGCEELEAVTVIDLLRRAGIEVVTAGLKPGIVKASRGVQLVPDLTLDVALRDWGLSTSAIVISSAWSPTFDYGPSAPWTPTRFG